MTEDLNAMKMDSQQTEDFRKAILNVLDQRGSDQFGLGVMAIQTFLVQFGFRGIEPGPVTTELQYLADKGLVSPVGKTISPENRCWRITANGRDFLAA